MPTGDRSERRARPGQPDPEGTQARPDGTVRQPSPAAPGSPDTTARSDGSVRADGTGGRPNNAIRSSNAASRPDTFSLVVGAVFLGITAGWALTWTGLMPYAALGWFLPLLLIVIGLLGVFVSRRR